MSLIFGSLLYMVGSNYDLEHYDPSETRQAAKFWIGASTMIMNNIYNWAALGCILQLPLWVPVLRRELMNRMYSPGNYFLARTISGTIF